MVESRPMKNRRLGEIRKQETNEKANEGKKKTGGWLTERVEKEREKEREERFKSKIQTAHNAKEREREREEREGERREREGRREVQIKNQVVG